MVYEIPLEYHSILSSNVGTHRGQKRMETPKGFLYVTPKGNFRKDSNTMTLFNTVILDNVAKYFSIHQITRN